MYEIWAKQNYELKQINETEKIKNIKLYRRGVYEFELDERPKCKICGGDLKFIKIGNKLVIDKCLNEHCGTNDLGLKKSAPIKWKAFLPDYILEQQHKNHTEHTIYNLNYLVNERGFSVSEANEYINEHKNFCVKLGKLNKGKSQKERIIKKLGSADAAEKFIREYNYFCKEYWIKRGFTEEQAIQNISKIQSENSKKVKTHVTVTKQSLIDKGVDADLYMKEKSIFCKEYWIKRGFTEEQAIKNISKIQSENSKKLKISTNVIIHQDVKNIG